MEQSVFKRIVLKLSGEVLAGDQGFGIDARTLEKISGQIRKVNNIGVELAVVVGGGNIFRWVSAELPGLDRITGDHMGMLATLINALALKNCLDSHEVPSRIFSAISVGGIIRPLILEEIDSHLERGETLIFAGGTGHPYFTTDTAAVLRAVEIRAEVILKGTKVDGVYSADPVNVPHAILLRRLSFFDVLKKRLKVIDATAASLCMDNNLPLIVFNVRKEDTLKRILLGEPLGTMVKGEDND